MSSIFVALLSALQGTFGLAAKTFTKAHTRLEWARVRQEIRRIPELQQIYTVFRQSPEAGWTVAANDVLRLYRLILRYQPREILELGTGIGLSTAVMAVALKRLGRGRVTSLEQLPKCIELANSLLEPEMKQFVRLVHADPTIFRVDRLSRWIYFCGYDWQPKPGQQFDFVLIDGPSGWIEGGRLVSLDAGDVFRLLPNLAPGCKVYVDGRRSTVKKMRRYLGRYLTLIERDQEFALFERTSAPLSSVEDLVVEDAKLSHSGHPSPYLEPDGTAES